MTVWLIYRITSKKSYLNYDVFYIEYDSHTANSCSAVSCVFCVIAMLYMKVIQTEGGQIGENKLTEIENVMISDN